MNSIGNDNRAVLLIDRGSKAQAVREELQILCDMVKSKGGFALARFAFLEVTEPGITEVIEECFGEGAGQVVSFPYFLHYGLKCRLALEQVRNLIKRGLNIIPVERPLGVDGKLVDIVLDRIAELRERYPSVRAEETEILLIGHGSRIADEKNDVMKVAGEVERRCGMKSVRIGFLELSQPSIPEAVTDCLSRDPEMLFVIPYFLHFGMHIQQDVPEEVAKICAREKSASKIALGRHLGIDPRLSELILERVNHALKHERRMH